MKLNSLQDPGAGGADKTKLKYLSDLALMERTKTLAKKEQWLTLQVLDHLREIDRRKLFAKRGYPSLFSYVVKELGYCEASASQRIQAMRLMSQSREAKREIEKGTLKLSQAAQIQSFMRAEKKENGKTFSKTETKALVQKVSGLSFRDTVKKLKESVSAPAFEPLVRTETVVFEADEEFKQMLERIREIKGNLELGELMKLVFGIALDRIDPLRKAARKSGSRKVRVVKGKLGKSGDTLKIESRKIGAVKKERIVAESGGAAQRAASRTYEMANPRFKKKNNDVKSKNNPTPKDDVQSNKGARINKQTRYIAQQARLFVHKRSGGQCEFIDFKTGRRCESRYRLQYDHVRAHSRGGTSKAQNLQHLCAVHNGLKGSKTEDYRGRLKPKPIKSSNSESSTINV